MHRATRRIVNPASRRPGLGVLAVGSTPRRQRRPRPARSSRAGSCTGTPPICRGRRAELPTSSATSRRSGTPRAATPPRSPIASGTPSSAASATATLRAAGVRVPRPGVSTAAGCDMSRHSLDLEATARWSAGLSVGHRQGFTLASTSTGRTYRLGRRLLDRTRRRVRAGRVREVAVGCAARARQLLAVTAPAGVSTSSDLDLATGPTPGRDRSVRRPAADHGLRLLVSSAGPIAPFPWVGKVVAKAVTQVARAKIPDRRPGVRRDWKTSITGICPNVAPDSATRNRSSRTRRGRRAVTSTRHMARRRTSPTCSPRRLRPSRASAARVVLRRRGTTRSRSVPSPTRWRSTAATRRPASRSPRSAASPAASTSSCRRPRAYPSATPSSALGVAKAPRSPASAATSSR